MKNKNIFLRYNIKVKHYWVFCVIKKIYIFKGIIWKGNIIEYFVLLKNMYFFKV